MRIDVCISTKDRHGELALLLQSLREQDFQDFDIILIDDSQTPVGNCHYIVKLIQQLKIEGHKVVAERALKSSDNCASREQAVKLGDSPLICRLDDDVLIDRFYLTKLHDVIRDRGFDMASGITPMFGQPEAIRETERVKPVINKIEFDKEGNIVKLGDDCGYSYDTGEIIPAHHLRSCFMYKREIHEKDDVWYEKGLGQVAFREETFLSLRAAWKGRKMAVHTRAYAWHLAAPSGGVRVSDYPQQVVYGDERFRIWAKRMYQKWGDPFERKQDG